MTETQYPRIPFSHFESVFRAYIAASEKTSQFYDTLPSSVSAAFFDNPATAGYQEALDTVLKSTAAQVHPDLPGTIMFWVESPLEVRVRETPDSAEQLITGIDEVLAFFERSYFKA